MDIGQYLSRENVRSSLLALGVVVCLVLLMTYGDYSFAASKKDLKQVSTGVSDQLKAVAQLLSIVAYVAGVGFALAGVVQFKTHKDNPQQVPLSKPIVYIIVGACLLFLPTLIQVAGQSIFGGDQQTFTGTDLSKGEL